MISLSHWGMFDIDPINDINTMEVRVTPVSYRSNNQSHLDTMDTDARHKWLGLFGTKCLCMECQNEQ